MAQSSNAVEVELEPVVTVEGRQRNTAGTGDINSLSIRIKRLLQNFRRCSDLSCEEQSTLVTATLFKVGQIVLAALAWINVKNKIEDFTYSGLLILHIVFVLIYIWIGILQYHPLALYAHWLGGVVTIVETAVKLGIQRFSWYLLGFLLVCIVSNIYSFYSLSGLIRKWKDANEEGICTRIFNCVNCPNICPDGCTECVTEFAEDPCCFKKCFIACFCGRCCEYEAQAKVGDVDFFDRRHLFRIFRLVDLHSQLVLLMLLFENGWDFKTREVGSLVVSRWFYISVSITMLLNSVGSCFYLSEKVFQRTGCRFTLMFLTGSVVYLAYVIFVFVEIGIEWKIELDDRLLEGLTIALGIAGLLVRAAFFFVVMRGEDRAGQQPDQQPGQHDTDVNSINVAQADNGVSRGTAL